MDLKDQLKKAFPDYQSSEETNDDKNENEGLWIQDEPLHCKFEKRHGKATTVIDNYSGHQQDFKQLAKELKKSLGVGGSVKNDQIIIQGDYRPQIMKQLKERGFKVKRIGG